MTDLTSGAPAIAARHLLKDEKLLYATHPDPRSFVRWSAGMIALGIYLALVGACVLYIASAGLWGLLPSPVKDGQDASGAVVVGLPLFYVGYRMATFRRRAPLVVARTVYAVTDQRLLVIKVRRDGVATAESANAQEIDSWDVETRSNGISVIRIYRPADKLRSPPLASWMWIGIPDPQAMDAALHATVGRRNR